MSVLQELRTGLAVSMTNEANLESCSVSALNRCSILSGMDPYTDQMGIIVHIDHGRLSGPKKGR